MVLRRWEYYKKIWLNWPLFRALAFIRKGFTRRRANARKVSFRISLRWPIYSINSVDKTKLFCFLALTFIKYDMLVDLDEIVNRPPPGDDAIVNFALRIVL